MILYIFFVRDKALKIRNVNIIIPRYHHNIKIFVFESFTVYTDV